MADVSSPDISEAYADVRSDKSPTTWLIIDYENEKSNTLCLTATGDDGLDGLKRHLKDENASFAYIRIRYKCVPGARVRVCELSHSFQRQSNDEESFREKFCLITWIGSGVKVMRKAKISIHGSSVKEVLRAYSLDVAASSLDDLDEKSLVTRLRKAGGASYDRV